MSEAADRIRRAGSLRPTAMARRGYRTIRFDLEKAGKVAVYTSAKVADAMEEIRSKATLYEGVRLTQILEEVYLRGRKDGAKEALEQLDKSLADVKRRVPHAGPGRPKKRR